MFVAVALASSASAKTIHPDYQGTYAGIATTNSGKKVPFVLFVRQRGTNMEITARAKGYAVRLTAPESWVLSNTVQVDLAVPSAYKTIVTGSGTATFAKNAKLWEAVGDGDGTVLVTKSGSITAEGEMITRGFDEAKGDAWIATHAQADKADVSPAADKAPAISRAVAVAAPAAAQPPVPDPQKLATLVLIGLFIAVVILSGIIFGWNEPITPELKTALTSAVDAMVGYKAPEGGAS